MMKISLENLHNSSEFSIVAKVCFYVFVSGFSFILKSILPRFDLLNAFKVDIFKKIMSDSKEFILNEESILKKYTKVESRDYQLTVLKSAINGLNSGLDVGIDLPTGMGKTIIFSPIVAAAVESGYKTVLLSPTKNGQRRLKKEISKFLDNVSPMMLYGVSSYHCPLLKGKAQTWCCNDNKESYCIPQNLGCDIIKNDNEQNENNLIITNFSKFLVTSNKKDYDLIILDDSHSFENAKEDSFQVGLRLDPIRIFYEDYEIKNETLFEFVEGFLNLFAEVFESVSPEAKEAPISQDNITKFANDLINDKNEELLRNAIIELREKEKNLCWEMFYFVDRCRKSSRYEFYIRKDYYSSDDLNLSELISRLNEKSIVSIISKKFGNAKVIYATATAGKFSAHASSCTHRPYKEGGLEITPEPDSLSEVNDWFKKLKILVVDDIEDTRNESDFIKSMDLSKSILHNFTERSLLLFKNYRDQSMARDLLSKEFNPNDLYFIDAPIQNSDSVEEIANSRNISLASASTTVWEGININKLRIAIITTLPFIRPPIGQKFNFPYLERRMMIRLQQGIGRIIRNPDDFGVAILTEARFQNYVKKTSFNACLRDRVETIHSKDVVSEIKTFFDEWST